MFKKSLSLLAATLVCTPLLAQEPKVVGKTDDVKGLVTVSFGTNVSTVTGVIPILEKSRFVTASTGYATLKFDDGCDVRLEPNQAYTVESDRSCAARLLLVQGLPGAAGTVFAGASTGQAVGLYVGGILVLNALGGSGGAVGAGGGVPNPPPGDGGVVPNPPASTP